MKNHILLLLILQTVSISVNQPVQNPFEFDGSTINFVHNQEDRHRRALISETPSCSTNQYFDEDQRHCLNISGGGTLISINKTKSCGVDVMKPHCNNSTYYYICKRNKTILVQCAEGHYFEPNLQKCTTDRIRANREMFESIKLPACTKSGSFPVSGDCTLFYVCEIKGSRMFQTIFKCPKTMIYDAETEVCNFCDTCNDTSSNMSSPLCEPSTGRKIIVSPNEEESKEADVLSTTDTMSIEISTTGYVSIPPEFTVQDDADTMVTTDNYQSVATATSYPADEFAPTTVSYIEEMPLVFVQLGDNFDTLNSTEGILDISRPSDTMDSTISSTTLEELNSSIEAATTDSSLQTSTLGEIISSKQYDMIGTTEDSITSTAYLTSGTSGFTSLEELSSSTEISTEPPVETSTAAELSLIEPYEALGRNTMEPATHTTEFTLLDETYLPTETGTSEILVQTSTPEEIELNEEYNATTLGTIDPIVGVTFSAAIDEVITPEVTTEQSTTEFDWAEFTSTVSSTESSTSSELNDENMTSSFPMLTDPAFLLNEMTTSTEMTALIDTTTDPSDYISTESSTVNTTPTEDSTVSTTPTESSTVNTTPTESSTVNTTPTQAFLPLALLDVSPVPEPDNASNDFTLSNTTDTANSFNTESAEYVTYRPDELDDTSSDIPQIIQNLTSTLDIVASLESTILTESNKNGTLHSADLKLNSNFSTETATKSCEEMLKSLLANIQTNEALIKNVTVAEKKNVTSSQTLNPRRRPSRIALPLTSAVLNITERFQKRIRNLLNRMSSNRA